ncbi:MAG TPA: DUF397 domain-containing protein [Streptosporangiaceae bacterium]
MDLSNATWRKSSCSGGNGGNCIEVAVLPDTRCAVRDSKDPDGPRLVFNSAAWLVFAAQVKDGTHNLS